MSGQLSRFDGNKSDWATPDSVPDPKVLPRVFGYNVLIRPVNPKDVIENKEKGSKIIMPASLTEDIKYLTNVGRVVALGDQCYKDPNVKPADGKYFPYGRYEKPWCKVGDYVTWGRHQGVKYEYQGVVFLLIQDELILLGVDNPGDINPLFNI